MIDTDPRRFIDDIRLPLLLRMRLHDPVRKPRGWRRLGRKLAQTADDLVHGWMKLPATGTFSVRMADGTARDVRFDAHESAYLAFVGQELHGGYEPAETRFIDAMLARARNFYDVGANWGHYTLLAATHPRFSGGVYAFEVSDRMNSALGRMVETLALDTVEIAGFGLSGFSGYATVTADRASHLTRVVGESDRPDVPTLRSRVMKLDDVSFPRPDLMKIDVEDHEINVLRGGRQVLERHRPLILFESREQGDGGDAGGFLRSLGYRLYGLDSGDGSSGAVELSPVERSDPRSGPANIVAVPSGRETHWFG